MNEFHASKGISLLEIMIAFAFTTVLLAVTMPHYQDYTVRARISEGLNTLSSDQDFLLETCASDPSAKVSAGYETVYASETSGQEREFVFKTLVEADCAKRAMSIVVWTWNTGADPDPVLELSATYLPDVVNGDAFGEYDWTCRVIRGELSHVPAGCQKRHRGN
jgi:type IV pilus assembly protein PilA